MSNPTSSIRVDVKNRLYQLLADEFLEDVTVAYGHPREGITSPTVFLGKVTGEQSIPDMRAGRKRRRDVFTVEIWMVAIADGDQTGEEADAVAASLLARVDGLFADKPTLSDDGANGLPGLHHCYLTKVDGPVPDITDQGRMAFYTADLHCTTTTD